MLHGFGCAESVPEAPLAKHIDGREGETIITTMMMILMRMAPMMKCGIIVTSSLSCLTRVTLSPINNTTA